MKEVIWAIFLIMLLLGSFFIPLGWYLVKKVKERKRINKLPQQEKEIIRQFNYDNASKSFELFAFIMCLAAFGFKLGSLHAEKVEWPVTIILLAVACLSYGFAHFMKKR